MIAYMPEIYPDELIYSWFCRYYAHSGYSGYVTALDDLLESRYSRVDMEFCGRLNEDAKAVITTMYDMEDLILNHTMFPQYARFVSEECRDNALQVLITGNDNIRDALPIPNAPAGQTRHLRYCPVCTRIDQSKYGETYWHRIHQLRNINICPIHKCSLIETSVEMAAKNSPRLWVAEEVIGEAANSAAVSATEKEIIVADLAAKLLQAPIIKHQPDMSEWLVSQLNGTDYISARGKRKYVSRLFEDLRAYYSEKGEIGITKPHQLQKLFTGYNHDFYQIVQLVCFLGIPAEEVMTPVLPEKSQTELFDEKVLELRKNGLGNHRCARELDCSPSTAINCIKIKEKAPHDYAVRKGMKRQDWDRLDKESLDVVKTVCERIYTGDGDRPRRVTCVGVEQAMGWPGKRLQYLPKCKSVVQEYHEETEQYWAREVAWVYKKFVSEHPQEDVCWRRIRDMTNMRKTDFKSCFPYLEKYADEITAERIKELI